MELSHEQWVYIDEIHDAVRHTGKPTFQFKKNWPELNKLARAGMIEMGPHPDFSSDFKAVSLTQKGMLALADRKARGWKRK